MDNLPPYTNVSLKLILTNPEGRKESDDTIIQTDEDGGTLILVCAGFYVFYCAFCGRLLPFLHLHDENQPFFWLILTVPGPVPSQSLRAIPSEDSILLYWKKPSEPNGIIIQYEVT